jgi:predicted nucleic acid-binding protein
VNLVDSSGWLEYFANTSQAGFFARSIEEPSSLIIPTISLYEVTKVIRRERGNQPADEAAALMTQGKVIDLNVELALLASTFPLPLADSIIYATAQKHGATLWTQDEHFKGLPGVKFLAKRRQ